jgi:acyl-CoA hydrolase
MTRTKTASGHSRIAAHARMVSVNTAVQVDLSDQAGASHIAGRLYPGFGG